MKFLDLKIGMELLSIISSNIAFTMGAKGPLLEKSYLYKGNIERYQEGKAAYKLNDITIRVSNIES